MKNYQLFFGSTKGNSKTVYTVAGYQTKSLMRGRDLFEAFSNKVGNRYSHGRDSLGSQAAQLPN